MDVIVTTTTADAVSPAGSQLMLDGSTYGRGAELSFPGPDVHVTGGGVHRARADHRG